MLGKCILKYRFYYILLLVCLLCFPSLFENEEARALDTSSIKNNAKGIGYASIIYNNQNGLPTSEANAIAQTNDGFMWIGGYSGLFRYDGNSFYRYDSSYGISSVVSLLVDSKGVLWIGTNETGLIKYFEGKFTTIQNTSSSKSYSIRSIAEGGDGHIYIATTNGLFYVDGDNMNYLDDPELNRDYIEQLKTDKNGKVYGKTYTGTIFSLEELKVSAYYKTDIFDKSVPKSIYPDPTDSDYMYIGTTDSHIYRVCLKDDMKSYSIISAKPHTCINDMYYLNNKLWVCTDDGIGFVEDGRYIPTEGLPMDNSVDTVIEDHEGNLWFTSSRQGVLKIVKNRFTNIFMYSDLPETINNTTLLYNKNLYIGTDNGLIVLNSSFKPQKNEFTKFFQDMRIRCIRSDSKDNIWFCTYSDYGLVCYHDGNFISFSEKNGLLSNRVRTIYELSDGSLAVATSNGVNIIKDLKIVDKYDSSNGISNAEILSISETKSGEILLGSDGNGIYMIKNGKTKRMGVTDGLTSEVILRIIDDPNRDIKWIITSNSIAVLNEDFSVDTITNFPYTNNFDMFFDKNDRIWVLSSNGIYVVQAKEMFENPKDFEYTLYDSTTGLNCVATANSRSHITEDGLLFISGSTVVDAININETSNNESDIRLSIPFIEVDDEPIYVGNKKKITIPPTAKRVNISGYAFTYSLMNPHIKYRLKGFESKYTHLTKQQMDEVTYTNLNGGTYTFEMSIMDTLSGEVTDSISLRITKQKALMEQLWFKALLAILTIAIAISAIIFFVRRKTAKLEKKQKENRIFINQIIQAFAKCIDMKDSYTNGHSFRVARYTKLMASRLGYEGEKLEDIYNTALLHDIGKISIPDNILGKPGKLTDEEFATIKSHAKNGHEILKDIKLSPGLANGAGYHHERIDGKGYPEGFKGDEIPFVARIIAVADTFDAMYSNRPYRRQMKLEDVVAEIKRVSGTQLSPEVVEVFLKLVEEGAFDERPEAE